MNLQNFAKNRLFFFKHRAKFFLKNWLFMPFLAAFLFSLPLYINIFTYHFGAFSPLLSCIFALLSIYIFLTINKNFAFLFGFFVGILWFYWVGLSFRFTNVVWLGILAVIFVAFVYGILFYLSLFFRNPFIRAGFLCIFSKIVILGFDWFVPDSLLAFSAFGVDKMTFCAIVFILAIFIFMRKKWRFFVLAGLIFCLDFSGLKAISSQNPSSIIHIENLAIKISQTDISQHDKWNKASLKAQIDEVYGIINSAIDSKFSAVILPEMALPLNILDTKNSFLLSQLKALSHKITIILGAPRFDGKQIFNSTFVFENGNFSFADKIYLAPFGEYMPVPQIAFDVFSKISGLKYSSNFDRSNLTPQNLAISNIHFRNAICYEATTRAIYEDARFIIATSNNAWFKPSIEPILQMTLIKYYARLYGSIVLLSANGSKSLIIDSNI